MGVTVVLEIGRALILRQVAERLNSASLGALATDKLADLMSVSAVLLGLAAVLAALILRAAVTLMSRATDVLMDRSVSNVEREVLAAAGGVEGVREARMARV